ncbi:DEAD/DEAH box helicase [Pyrodictium abyssi]|uniref:ATP-dependent DNA helicase Hel308 n=1 Tax=Pyrodictium abyssi TaxID=54256 RepID=A0ABN6ZUP8_9CREN|nr:DEAD/DEAH box helicase [Pyrodictium abyssi]
MRVEELALPVEAKRVLLEHGYSELFPPQREAVRAGLLEGRSIVVASPTGSGKSLIALLAALRVLGEPGEGCRVVYAAPLRSLVYERAGEWRSILEKLGRRVAVSTGDYDRVEPWLGEADAVMVTYEKLDSLLRHGAGLLAEVCVFIVDEIHYVGDARRGPVLETVIARLMAMNDGMQVVALSATISNAGEIAAWLGARLVESSWRPVRLREGVFNNYVVEWSDGEETRVEKRTRNPTLDAALDAVAGGGQALIFVNSRRKAVELAEKLAAAAASNGEVRRLLDPGGAAEPYVEELRGRHEHRELNEKLARLLGMGVGFHHAGLASYQRDVVEKAFRARVLRVLVATPTLAAGVNLPARRVVVDTLYRFRSGRGSEPIKVSEYKQLAGRAGRPGLDPVGEAVIIARTWEQAWEALVGYVKGEPEPIVSKLVSEAALRSQVLAVVSSLGVATVSEVASVFERTLYAVQVGPPFEEVDRITWVLDEYGFVSRVGDVVEATETGRRVAELYIDPLTGYRMLRGLEALRAERPPIERLLFLSLWSPDATRIRPPRGLHLALEMEAEQLLEDLGFKPYEEVGEADIAVAAEALYTADMLLDWVMEKPEDAILAKYGIDPGDLRAVVETTNWLVYSMAQLARITGHPAATYLDKLTVMVKHGVQEELVELVKLPGIGRVRARRLYEAGYRNPGDLAGLSPEQLASLLRGLGEERARQALVEAQRTATKRETASQAGAQRKRQRSILDYLGG